VIRTESWLFFCARNVNWYPDSNIWFPLCWQACLVGAVDRFDEGTAVAPPSLIRHVRGMFRRPSTGYIISPIKIDSF
jgi:hypothetical protein